MLRISPSTLASRPCVSLVLPETALRYTCLRSSVSAAPGPGLLCPSRLLRRKDAPPMTKLDVANMLGSTTHTFEGTSPLELNLFEDPTGGLASGPAEEMTAAEVETHVRLLVPAFPADLFRLLYTPFVDILFVLVSEGLVPDPAQLDKPASHAEDEDDADYEGEAGQADEEGDGVIRKKIHFRSATEHAGAAPDTSLDSSAHRRPEQIMVRWFTDGVATLQNPDVTREGMGEVRWARFCHGLRKFCEPMESVQPLTRTVRKYGLREDLFVPLMRQIALNLVEPDVRKTTIASLPSFILGLANGRAPASLSLPQDHAERVQAVSEVFLSAGQETGNTDLAYLGIQLVRANNMAVPYRLQKQLTNVFAASARIQTDWQFRVTGQLVEAYPRWLDYFRKVAADNAHALQVLTRTRDADSTAARRGGRTGNSAPTTSGGFAEDEPSRDYFASHREDDEARSLALQDNIETSVRLRAPLLAPWLQRTGRRRHTTPPPLTQTEKIEAASEDETSVLEVAARVEQDARPHHTVRKKTTKKTKSRVAVSKTTRHNASTAAKRVSPAKRGSRDRTTPTRGTTVSF